MIEKNSPDCGYKPIVSDQYKWFKNENDYICGNDGTYQDPVTRWVVVTGETICEGTSLYNLEFEEIQLEVDGKTYWVKTGDVRTGDLIEESSENCGFITSCITYRWEYDWNGNPFKLTVNGNKGKYKLKSSGETCIKEELKNLSNMFSYAIDLDKLNVDGLSSENVTDMSHMFDGCTHLRELTLGNLSTASVKNMAYMFDKCFILKNIDLSNFMTRNVTDMSYMFAECNFLSVPNLNCLDTSNVTDMEAMFYDCNSFGKVSLDWQTQNVINMSHMFEDSGISSVDLSRLDVSNVKYMVRMFAICRNLTSIDLNSWNTSSLTDMTSIFYESKKLNTVKISNLNTSNVTRMTAAFCDCEGLTELDLSGWDTSNVQDMRNIFWNCRNLTTLYLDNFDASSVTELDEMFNHCVRLKYIRCKQSFKDWCMGWSGNIDLPDAMGRHGSGTWDIVG